MVGYRRNLINFKPSLYVLKKIITKDGYEGTDDIVSSEAHKACSGNSGHQNQLANGISRDCHLPNGQKQISECM